MKSLQTIMIFFMLLATTYSQPYSFYQNISIFGYTETIDITDDSSIMVAGTLNKQAQVYEAGSDQYNSIQTITQPSDIEGVDITGDGELLAYIVEAVSAHVLEKQPSGTFSEIQQLSSGSGQYRAVAISDDGELLFYGKTTDVEVVKRSGATYSALTTLSGFSNYVSDIKITPDKTYVVVASMLKFNVLTYDSSDDSFEAVQEVSYGSSFSLMKIEITDDHQYITVNHEKNVYIYSFNDTSKQFDLWQSWTGLVRNVFQALLNYDRDMLVICDFTQSYIYRVYANGTNQLLQTLGGSTSGKMSRNNSFLFLANFNGIMTVYIHCDQKVGYALDPVTDVCSCDTANGYQEFDDSSCGKCSITGCLSCSSSSACSSCNNASGYFLNSTSFQCQTCDVEGCLECASLGMCSSCNEPNNYFLNTPSFLCDLCQIEGCLSCSDISTCQTCDERNNYFLNSTSGECEPCDVENCLQCSDSQNCSECVSGYELNGDVCEEELLACDVEYCSECSDSSAQICVKCIEDYYLMDDSCHHVENIIIACSVIGGAAALLVGGLLVYKFLLKAPAPNIAPEEEMTNNVIV